MTTTHTPGTDVHTREKLQEAALLAAFCRLTPKGRMMAFKAARRLRAEQRRLTGQ
jgi:hypothetical protein